jgi:NAD(P)-dependent dehydrogenase (short-subunit alcohol dehydrogenase family)
VCDDGLPQDGGARVTAACDREHLGRHVDQHHGRLDVLHSNAFAQLNKSAHEMSEAEWDGQMAVLLNPPGGA